MGLLFSHGPKHAEAGDRNAQTGRAISQRVASVPVLLVALEYQDIVGATEGDADAQVFRLLRELSELPHTHVAIISRRSTADLQRLFEHCPRVLIAGDHGNGFELSSDASIPHHQQEERQQVFHQLLAIARDVPGVHVELKPRGVLVEYRGAPEAAVTKTLGLVGTVVRSVRHLSVKLGTMVVEFGVERTNKAAALSAIRHRVGANAVLFMGSHETDEEAFRSLLPIDAGVRVGRGSTSATHTIADRAAVGPLLERVLADRR
ncbi:MAG TPA: trehalose-phosphatase, partial [Phycisphaerales bacterium]|nr:trehalose-phosphatase [Phycisphaerales bacterium]